MPPLIARGAAAAARAQHTKKVAGAARTAGQAAVGSADVVGAAQLLSSVPSRKTTGERYLEERDTEFSDTQRTQEEEREMRRQQLIEVADTIQGAAKSQRILPIQKTINPTQLSRGAVRGSIGIAITAYLWQFFFAIVSLVGFALHGQMLYLREETFIGSVIGFFFDFQEYLPFESLGYAAWGITVCITIVLFVGYLLYFVFTGVTLFKDSVAFIITASCLALNIFPFTNVFPWLLIWICYILLFNK